MQYDVDTPEAYLEALESDWRRDKLLELRALIMSVMPDLSEQIHYKMLGYASGEDYVLHLNAQKGYVSLYVGNIDKVDPDGTLLKKVKRGKGCIRFSKSVAVEESGVADFLERVKSRVQSGSDIGCH